MKKVIFLIISIIIIILLIIFLPQEKTKLQEKDYPIIENLDSTSNLVQGLYAQIQIFNEDIKTGQTYFGYLYQKDQLLNTEIDDQAIIAIGLNQSSDLKCNIECYITTSLLDENISEVLGNIDYDHQSFSERINGLNFNYENDEYTGVFNDYDTNSFVKVYSNLIESKKTIEKDKTTIVIKERVAYRLYNVMNETYEVYNGLVMIEPLIVCPYLDDACIEDYINSHQNKFNVYEYQYILENDNYIFKSIKKSN